MFFTYCPSIPTGSGFPAAPNPHSLAASPPPSMDCICSVCHDTLPLEDFIRKGNRKLLYAYESCNGCSEKRLARLKRAENRVTALIAVPAPRSRAETPGPRTHLGAKAGLDVVPNDLIANTFSLPFRANTPPTVQPPLDVTALFKATALPISPLHCSSIPSTPTTEQQHIQHYALATRLSLLHNHWDRGRNETKALRKDWYRQITLLQKTALNNAALAPWALSWCCWTRMQTR